ncbi:hypothetical protein [Neorhizobium sp. DT-125]|uniref:hypothetical protein n=1 Tax=Neorhizobium sp. DT-125 TaxID=3396163 RepID=UPI003F1DE165
MVSKADRVMEEISVHQTASDRIKTIDDSVPKTEIDEAVLARLDSVWEIGSREVSVIRLA